MKKSNYELYEIINELNDTELRFFTKQLKNAIIHDDVKLLFKIIKKYLKFPKLDENEIIIAYKKPNFTKRKFELNQFLQECLVQLYKNNSIKEWQDELNFCEYLNKKGLFKIAYKKLLKLKEKTAITDYFTLQIDILELERKLLFNLRGSVALYNLENIFTSIDKTIQQQIEATEYNHLITKLYELQFQKTKINTQKPRDLIEQYKVNPKLQTTYEPLSFKSKMLQYQLLGMLAFMEYDIPKAYLYNSTLIEFFDEEPFKIAEFPEKYFAIWSNYLTDCSSLKKADKVKNAVQQMNAFVEDGKFSSIPRLEEKIMMRTYNVQLNGILNYNDFTDAEKIIDELFIDLEDKLINQTIHRKVILCFLAALILFKLNINEKAKSFLAIAYTLEKRKQVQDIVVACKMLEIIIFYEEESFDTVDFFLSKLKNYLSYRKIENEYEAIFIKLFNKLILAKSKIEIKETNADFILKFQSLDNVPEIYERLEIEKWLTN